MVVQNNIGIAAYVPPPDPNAEKLEKRRVLRNELLSARGERITEIMAELASSESVAVPPTPEEAARALAELSSDCARNLSNFSKHESSRDCRELRAQINSQLRQLIDAAVVAARKAALEQLHMIYAKRWHRGLSRLDTDRTVIVEQTRLLHIDLNQAKTAIDYKKIFEQVSLSEPGLLRTEEG